MTPKQQSNDLIGKFSMNILAELGHKISLDEVAALAKSSSIILLDEILAIYYDDSENHRMEEIGFWHDVRNEIKKL